MVSILDLPFELHCEIINKLPLGAKIIYQTQICQPLRILFAGKFTLPQPSTFRLVEWRRASSEVAKLLQRDDDLLKLSKRCDGENSKSTNSQFIQVALSKKSIWDTSPSSTPKPAPAKVRGLFKNGNDNSALVGLSDFQEDQHRDAMAILPSSRPKSMIGSNLNNVPHADHSDVNLFARCMKLLGRLSDPSFLKDEKKTFNQSNLMPVQMANQSIVLPIRVLSLLSRTGFKVASLIYFLQTIPALHSVETILMTSAGNAELILWSLFQPLKQTVQWPHNVSPVLDLYNEEKETIPMESSTCTETQAIVIPGPNAKRGQGLRSGFKCLCFHAPHQHALNDTVRNPTRSPLEKPFHVIFHDWYDEAEAEGTQDMLHHSEITCNTCKKSILF